MDINQAVGTTISGPSISMTSNTGNINQNGLIDNTAGDLAINAAQAFTMATGASTVSAGDINIVAGAADLQTITASNALAITTNMAGITQNQALTSTTATVDLNAASSITMQAAASTQAAGNINYQTISDQTLTTLTSSAGSIAVTASNGAIIDGNADETNLRAAKVILRANNGIGSDDGIETLTGELDVINVSSGSVEIANTGNVLLTNLVNNGDIVFDNNENVTINNIDAGFTVGRLQMSVSNGSVFGVDRGIGNGFFEVADISADTAIIFVADGEFGTFERPIILNINSEFFLASSISSTFFLGGPPPINNDTSDLQFSVFDSINSVSGQQLIEVESLADIDPAIFTNLQNFNMLEISIRLPRDQIFEHELEAYDRF